jgi:SAM-dependent methyltransferase
VYNFPMNSKTATQLNEINQHFYKTVWSEFDGTRQQPWEGWSKLLPFIWELPQPLRVLDAGCGNGRFGEFLSEHLAELHYTGIDRNPQLLTAGRKNLTKAKFMELDLTDSEALKTIDGSFDLIVLMAVMHHIPDFRQRVSLLKRLKQKLTKGGLLIFTAWQFTDIPALKERIIPWDNYPQINIEQLEENDYLIDWQRGEHAIRYCHLIDRKEINQITQALSLTKVAQFFADGKEGKSNIYVVLKKE